MMSFTDFLQRSYTAYHAVQEAVNILRAAGFKEVRRDDLPVQVRGDRYYTVEGGTSLFAWRVGDDAALMLAECHTDSPALRVKGRHTIPSPEGNRINVEQYGGLLLYSMLDIPLRVAGRVVVATREGVRTRLVESPATVVIPSLCIHHNPNANNLTLNVQQDMMPMVGAVPDVYHWLCPDETVLDADLMVVPDVAPFYSGADGEYLSSPRLDDLAAVYAGVKGLIEAKPRSLAMLACFDHEEIGSGTKQGAASVILPNLVADIRRRMADDVRRNVDMALSVDNGHAGHPAHPEKSDVQDAPVLGGGIVIKHHVNYATTGLSAGLLKCLLRRIGVPYQEYYNRSDIRCGSTLGNIAARGLGIDTVDIGLPQLAMHSAIELAHRKDEDALERAITAFFGTALIATDADAIDVLYS